MKAIQLKLLNICD